MGRGGVVAEWTASAPVATARAAPMRRVRRRMVMACAVCGRSRTRSNAPNTAPNARPRMCSCPARSGSTAVSSTIEAASSIASIGVRKATATAMPTAMTATEGPVSRSVRWDRVMPSHEWWPVTTTICAQRFTPTCVAAAMSNVLRLPTQASASNRTMRIWVTEPRTGRRGAGAMSERGLRAMTRQIGWESRTALTASTIRAEKGCRRIVSQMTTSSDPTRLSLKARQPRCCQTMRT